MSEETRRAGCDLQAVSAAGIERCRSGDWESGLGRLRQVAEQATANEKLPGLFYSYLGYGIADSENRYKQGLSLCKLGAEVGLFEAETYLLLARTYMLLDKKRPAIRVLDRGLEIDRNDRALRCMRESFGVRSRLPVPFLERGHFLNRCIGEMRRALLSVGGHRTIRGPGAQRRHLFAHGSRQRSRQ